MTLSATSPVPPDASLSPYRAEREALVNRLTEILRADPRVGGAWLIGSQGSGKSDELSDTDLWVVVADEHLPALIADRRAYVAQAGAPVLIVEAPQNAPVGGAYLGVAYDAPTGPQMADWYWQAQSAAFIPRAAKVLFNPAEVRKVDKPLALAGGPPDPHWEADPFNFISTFWMMVMIGAKRARRAPHVNAMELFSTLLHPLDQINHLLHQTAAAPTIPLLPSAISKLRFLESLAEEMHKSIEQLAAQGVRVPTQAPAAVEQYLALVRGSLPPRR